MSINHLIRRFNNGVFLNERSTLKELYFSSTGFDEKLSQKINRNKEHLKSYKAILLVLESTRV